MVRGITKNNQPRSELKIKPAAIVLGNNNTAQVGETDCFRIDYDDKNKLVALYGKETPKEYPFKIKLTLGETVAIYRLLGKALGIMRNNAQTMRVGEKNNFVVDYDGSHRRVLLYQKEKAALCQFKLSFDEHETMMIIHFLKKARNFFWT